MQITPFGRIDVNVDDLPRINPTSDSEFSRRLREKRREIKLETPDRHEVDDGQTPDDAQPQSSRVERSDRTPDRRDKQERVQRKEQTEPEESDNRVIVDLEKAQPEARVGKKGETSAGKRLPFQSFSEEKKTVAPQSLLEGGTGMSAAADLQGMVPGLMAGSGEQGTTAKGVDNSNKLAAIQQNSESTAPSTGRAKQAASTHKPQAPKVLELSRQNKDSIFKSIAFSLSKGKSEALLLIDPPHLGALSVKLTMRGNDLFLQISAERPEVAKALKQDLLELKEILQDQGLNVQGFEVRTGSRHEQSRQARLFNNKHAMTGTEAANDDNDNSSQNAGAEAARMQRTFLYGSTVDFVA